ncbi:MAG: ATP-grasp domain-containing protein [Candidatus Anammoxibacter sp.]
MFRKNAIIIIGGSFLQLPQIHWAKELDLHVVVTDQNPDVPGRAFADHFVDVSGADIPALLKLANYVNNDYNLIGAYAGSDFGIPVVSAIAEKFNLPGCSSKAVQDALDKGKVRQILQENDLPLPQGFVVANLETAKTVTSKLSLPVIIKPVNSSGSQGVRSVWNMPELTQAYEEANAISRNVLVEELVSGRHIDVNGLFINDQFTGCGIAERFFSPLPFHYPIWGCQPALLDDVQEASIYKLVEKAARTLCINTGPVKTDLILGKEGPTLIELSPRFHGDVGTSFMVPLSTGSCPIKAFFAYLKGDEQAKFYLKRTMSHIGGWRALFPDLHGCIKHINGIEAVKAMPNVAEVFITVSIGDRIETHKDNTTVCGFIWSVGDSYDKVKNVLEEAASQIQFEVD